MALAAAPKPITIKDVELTIAGTTDYAAHVNSVMLTPNTTVATWRGALAGSNQNDATTPSWTLDITYVQDFSTGALARYLWDNQGKTVTGTFRPLKGGVGFQAEFVILAGGIGGALDAVATSTSSFPVNGQPSLVQPVTP